MNYPQDLGIDKELSLRLSQFFSSERIESIAKSTKFVERRSSRLSGLMFLQMNIFGFLNEKDKSLTEQCDYLEDSFDISLTKQSLDERYNTYAVSFMKRCYEAMLLEVLQPYLIPLDFTNNNKEHFFNGIELVDSTVFDISANLEMFYKGGANVKSAIKIQHRYELIKGETLGIKIVEGNEADASYLSDLGKNIVPNRLYIKDLGYYKLEHLLRISKEKAYFLSRYKNGTKCYTKDKFGKFEEVDMVDLVPKYGANKDISEIYIGEKKHKVRMIIESVPEEYVEKRKKKVIDKNKSMKKETLHKNAMILCLFNVYITNADESILAHDKIRLLYALRWQIELILKIWKSIFNIDKEVKKMNIFRFECYLYGRFMAILLSEKIQNLYRDYLWEEKQLEISEFKCAKLIKKKLDLLRVAIEQGTKAILVFFDKIFSKMVKRGIKEKKRLPDKSYRITPKGLIDSLA
jgi:hypothetical protein